MPRRTAEEKLERYRNKIRRLEEKYAHLNPEVIRSEDEYEENIPDHQSPGQDIQPSINETLPVLEAHPLPATTIINDVQDLPSTTPEVHLDTEPSPLPGLDPEILSALGVSTDPIPEFGPNIHESLASLWPPILKKGLSKEEREKFSSSYLTPENCKLLLAPKLNPEISAAINEISRYRDKKVMTFQKYLGTGISAITKALDLMITSPSEKVESLKHLGDSCRILCDVHYQLTKDRIKLIQPSMDKNFLPIINESERDDTLFGNSLAEKIRANKAIERQGNLIRKTAVKQTSGPSTATASRATNAQGNWSGPPRYSGNRGGRGYQRRPPSTSALPPPPRRSYQNNQQKYSSSQPRPRAPPRH